MRNRELRRVQPSLDAANWPASLEFFLPGEGSLLTPPPQWQSTEPPALPPVHSVKSPAKAVQRRGQTQAQLSPAPPLDPPHSPDSTCKQATSCPQIQPCRVTVQSHALMAHWAPDALPHGHELVSPIHKFAEFGAIPAVCTIPRGLARSVRHSPLCLVPHVPLHAAPPVTLWAAGCWIQASPLQPDPHSPLEKRDQNTPKGVGV